MKILFVASTFDSQTSRWIGQISNLGWDLHIFDRKSLLHPELFDIKVHTGWKKRDIPSGTRVRYKWPFLRGRHWMEKNLPWLWAKIVPEAGQMLAEVINEVKPDLIHILGSNPYGYWFLDTKRFLGKKHAFPWIYSNKGSDIYYWGQFPEHKVLLKELLSNCHYYMANCQRDVALAEQLGFHGQVLGLFQGVGGFPVSLMQQHRRPGRITQRRVIAIKGLQHFAGRALVALDAIEKCNDTLVGYEAVIYQAHKEVRIAAQNLQKKISIPIKIFGHQSPNEFYKLLGQSRISIGISISDGIPNAMIESMIMGAFPIQTDPGGATSEWIVDGINGIIVPPDDPQIVAEAIQAAIANDRLVNDAAKENLQICYERIDENVVRPKVISAYKEICNKLR